MSDNLTTEQFSDFFFEINGYRPYPWQMRLLEKVDATGWPAELGLPTGSGKTSVLEIAIFSLAVQSELPAVQRTAPRRIFFVIDRRIVVDAAFSVAMKIESMLRSSLNEESFGRSHPVCRTVAARLKALALADGRLPEKEVQPLKAHALRGGFYRSNDWASSLTQPIIVCSTIDQVGSRLLFRGYGISSGARPLQAALVGTDSLIILDEAHTATAMASTLQTVRAYQRRDNDRLEKPLAPLPTVVQMTATMPPAGGGVSLRESLAKLENTDVDHAVGQATFSLDPKLDLCDAGSPLSRRYMAIKPVMLDVASAAKGKAFASKLAKDLVKRVVSRLDYIHENEIVGGSIAVVVNRIATARQLYQMLSSKCQTAEVDLELMIGRMRPIDRDQSSARIVKRLKTPSQSDSSDAVTAANDTSRPVVVIATQCIEVGADLDFQYMISEAASFDALRQRFGRLNRSGLQKHVGGEVVIRVDQQLEEKKLESKEPREADFVYGRALSRTFNWLNEISENSSTDGNAVGEDRSKVDFGSAAMDQKWKDVLAKDVELARRLLIAQPSDSVLMPAHLKLLVQTATSPAVSPDPDVGIFLHGLTDRQYDVQVCWRADLATPERIVGENGKPDVFDLTRLADDHEICAAVTGMPPASTECMTISISAVKKFLTGDQSIDNASGDQAAIDEQVDRTSIPFHLRPAIYRGADNTIVATDTRQIRPGDTLVLPVCAGGWSILNHLPDSVADPAGKANVPWDAESMARLVAIDVATEAVLASRLKCRVRLYRAMVAAGHVTQQDLNDLVAKLESGELTNGDVRSVLLKVQTKVKPVLAGVIGLLLNSVPDNDDDRVFDQRAGVEVSQCHGDTGLVIDLKRRVKIDEARSILAAEFWEPDAQFEFSDDVSSYSPKAVPLDQHLTAVGQRAALIAKSLSLPVECCDSIERAAVLHDIGKADPSFQSLLIGGSAASGWQRPRLLAKSGRFSKNAVQRKLDRIRARLPQNFRHEWVSVLLCEQLKIEHDPLVLHLIASHHGLGRPWFSKLTAVGSDEVREQMLSRDEIDLSQLGIKETLPSASRLSDSTAMAATNAVNRFWEINQRFGAWNTALMEATLRLADQRISAEESFRDFSMVEKIPLEKSTAMPSNVFQDQGQQLVLTAIDGSNSLGFLAALGTFRLAHRRYSDNHIAPVKMFWTIDDGAWRPVIRFPDSSVSRESLIDFLFSTTEEQNSPTLGLLDEHVGNLSHKSAGKLTVDPKRFHHVAIDLVADFLGNGDRDSLDCDFASALSNECSRKRNVKEEQLDHSQFYMTKGSGHQRMLQLMRAIRADTDHQHFNEALFEEWRYADEGRGRSLRWDPSEDRQYARRWKNPSSDPVTTVRGANYLAIEALPFFPTAVLKDDLVTTGFQRVRRKGIFWTWPIWQNPVTVDALTSMLQLASLHPDRIPQEKDISGLAGLPDIGIGEVYRCERIRNDKYFNFSASTAVLI